MHLIRSLLDEVFGSENFVSQIVYRTSAPLGSKFVPGIFDHIIWYAKDIERIKFRRLFTAKTVQDDIYYDTLESPNGEYRKLTKEEQQGDDKIPDGYRVFANITLVAAGPNPNCVFPIEFQGKTWNPTSGRGWKTNQEGVSKIRLANRVFATSDVLRYKFFLDDFPLKELTNLWTDMAGASDKVYVVQTNTDVIQRCMLMTTDPSDLVLDPTCGSGTTAYVAEQWGRRWITCDTSRVALALARTRLMAAKYSYYYLADDYPQITQKNTDETIKNYLRQSVKSADHSSTDIRKGFIYERVPHVTLKSIANNPDIQEGMTRSEIDAAITRHAESETRYDQPYENKKIVRVSGPFTVESLSPHRVLSTADENMDGAVTQQEAQREQDFATMILDNLRKAGVQNTKKGERLKFNTLDSYAGRWLHAVGDYADAEGKTKRVAISIGPEQGTVSPQQVKEAAKEAVQGVGFDLLLVCGFAFDPHVSEEAKRYGTLMVLPTSINPDLAMGDELLKKTGAGNLFMVFGEPDVEITKQKDDTLIVEIKGVDVYDPTTGAIRSSTPDEIACWFIDTDYNGESFFVRHAYFTGADEPYDKLKRALKAEIDEAAWASLYRTVSRPFAKPETGKIAVKVINHYGDEVLKVFEV